MLINLLDNLKKLYSNGGISNINNRNLIKFGIYNDIMELMQKEKINYDIIEYCSLLIDKHDDYIMYISICED
tara:strand:- start:85 stop:300 length:216 start_codon:yes stop_codon:yes gene_type:complete